MAWRHFRWTRTASGRFGADPSDPSSAELFRLEENEGRRAEEKNANDLLTSPRAAFVSLICTRRIDRYHRRLH